MWVFGSVNKKIVSQRHVANAMPYICYKAINFSTAALCTKIDLKNAHGLKCFFNENINTERKITNIHIDKGFNVYITLFTLHTMYKYGKTMLRDS